jgi:hypothetical protein
MDLKQKEGEINKKKESKKGKKQIMKRRNADGRNNKIKKSYGKALGGELDGLAVLVVAPNHLEQKGGEH